MMKLHRLDLSGFKSFVDPSSLTFAGGVTAVVGPNGCGKSNISDALTWSLGEQSAKSLRGETMEDVIFNGSESRKPLGMAEVSLTLLTDDPTFPHAEDGKMTLTRRVFRSGESQYRLNGKSVRLKDIRDILMDTGLGLRAYSVIEQGKIGMILSGKPQERRRLLEEAAGITRYKARKKIAEVKLEEATANLLRINDIVSEVERNLRSLKRQAGNARRFQEKQAEWRGLLRAVLQGRASLQGARLAELRDELQAAVGADAELAAALHRDEAALAAGREELEQLAAALSDRHQVQARLAATIEGRQEFLKGARSTGGELEGRLAAGTALAERQTEEIAKLESTLAELVAKRASLAAERDEAAAAVAEDEQRIAEAEQTAAAAETQLAAERQALSAALGEITGLRNRLHREQLESEKGASQGRHLGEQLSLWSDQLQESAAVLESARICAASDGQRVADRAEALDALVAAHAMRRAALDALAARRRATREELVGSEQRREVLAELSRAHSERRATLRDALADAGLTEPDFLGAHLRALPGWERSLDLYLGELADAVLLAPDADAWALAGELSRSRASGTLLRPLPTPEASDLSLEDGAVVSTLAAALGIDPALAAALPPAYLVASGADAVRLAAAHPGVAFLSRERLWAQGGALHVQGDQMQPGLLAREREAAEIATRLPALRADLEALAGEIAAAERDCAQREQEIAAAQSALAELRQQQAVAAARAEDAANRHHRLEVERATLATEHEEIHRELERVAATAVALQADLERAERAHRELQESFAFAEQVAAASRQKRETLRTAAAARRGRLDLLDERLRGHDLAQDRLQHQTVELRRALTGWLTEADAIGARLSQLAASTERAEADLQAALEARAATAGNLVGEQEALDARRAELRALDESVQARRTDRESRRGQLEDLRVRQAALLQDAEHLAKQFAEEFHEAPPPEPEPAPQNLAELEADLARCKDALERIGPVNVLAADEYGEQETRQQFLTTQRADVVASVDSLKKTIREINQTSGERFMQTFAEVNANFGKTFSDLFRGGEAEMRLLDDEDLLESGIEIVARPPGKRLQNIMLMSGGEKALTAIALLFALFRTKPSPFCILDEVDAPLDDINTLRFVDLLREMSAETQFIVITHNKLTMEVASTLYGVTMEERGVSKMVSVELQELQPEERTAIA